MKIVVFTPADHFHSPIILRELGWQVGQHEINVITTPKLNGKNGLLSIPSQLVRIANESGWDYLISMLLAKICYWFFGIIERAILMRPFENREYISIKEVINHFRFKWLKIDRINSTLGVAVLRNIKPDVILTVFFNQVLKPKVVATARYGAVNIHPSYLPAYRGISPCFWELSYNKTTTGISFHYLTKEIDDGAILAQTELPVTAGDTFFSLYRRSAIKGAKLLGKVLTMVEKTEKGIPQKEKDATYFSVITPEAVRRFRRYRRKFAWLI